MSALGTPKTDSGIRRPLFSKYQTVSSRLRDLNMSATNIPSACRIANIDPNDAMILPDANPSRMEFSEGTEGPGGSPGSPLVRSLKDCPLVICR
jgi:hypothetical protein